MTVAVKAPDEPRPAGKYDLLVTIDPLRAVMIGITGAKAQVTGEIESLRHEGQIDLLIFRDLTVNGSPVQVADHKENFRLEKGRPYRLRRPLEVTTGPLTTIKAAVSDSLRKAPRLQINGTVLVFGRFKRFGFTHKRVIPVKIALSIENTLFD